MRKRRSAEQIVGLLRQADIDLGERMNMPDMCRRLYHPDTFPTLEMCPGGRQVATLLGERFESARLRRGSSECRDPYASADHDGTAIVTRFVIPSGQLRFPPLPQGCGALSAPPGFLNRGFEVRLRELKSLEGSACFYGLCISHHATTIMIARDP